MAFLVVSSITVPVELGSPPTRPKEEIGDRARAFDGTMRQTVRARKRSWKVRTSLMTRTDADALEAALQSTTLPLACSGDLLGGSVNCYASIDAWQPTGLGNNAHRVVLEFTLMEV